MATAADLACFRLKVREYRLLVNRNQSDLAAYLNLDYNELSNRLNAHKNTRFSHENIRTIVRALAEWGAITTRVQADELLDLMLCPHFSPVDLEARPLSKLENPAGSNLNSTPNTASIEQAFDTDPLHNLPQQLSSFIGRYKEIADLKKLVTQDKLRLITLVGAGGSGKTRLAYKLGAELVNNFAGGVWVVELASLNNPALIPQAIAVTLEVTEQSGQSIMESLVQYLHRRQVLLVLDNCEHLIEECIKVIQRLLEHSTGLQILATSREGLGITGEVSYLVPSLSLPFIGAEISTERVVEFEALQLFVERARAASPDFRLYSNEIPALIQICHRLDGIPLALELAAARTKILTLEQVQVRLNDRFHLLTGGNRTGLPRQQTLRALVDWSYNLLNEGEKHLLARVSIFAGSWDITAVEQVCGDNSNGPDEYEVLNHLTNLANKSLVVIDRQEGGIRYRLLETIKQYALEKLRESGEEAALRERHLTYFAQLAEDLGFKAMHHDQAASLKRLDQEHDNIRAGLDDGLKEQQADKVLQLASGLFIYWEMRGYYSEAEHYLDQAVALPNAKGVNRGLTLGWAGYIASQQGNIEKARLHFEEALSISKEHSDQKLRWHVLNDHGILEFKQGNLTEARRLYEETVPLSEGLPRGYKSVASTNLGLLLMQMGEYKEAGCLFEEGISVARELGNGWMTVNGLTGFGNLSIILEDYQAAQLYLNEALVISEEFGYRNGKVTALISLSTALSQEGKLVDAHRLLVEGVAIAGKGNQRIELWGSLIGTAVFLSKIWLKESHSEHLEQAVCLCGAISGLAAAKSQGLGQPSQKFYDQVMEIARTGLNDPTFKAAFSDGHAMPYAEAVIFARQVLAGIKPG